MVVGVVLGICCDIGFCGGMVMPKWTRNPSWWATIFAGTVLLIQVLGWVGGTQANTREFENLTKSDIQTLKQSVETLNDEQANATTERHSFVAKVNSLDRKLYWIIGRLNGGLMPPEFREE